MTWGAVAVAGATVVGSIISSNKQAGAAASAAEAQERAAGANLAQSKKDRDAAVKAADSPQELAALERSFAAQETNLARSEKLLASVDPALMEASQQALRLLRGEDASVLAPLKSQRARQRKLLLDQLRSQLGPGAETSSAGIQALTQFDQETSGLVAGAQQSSLGQLLGSAQTSSGQGRQGAAQAAGGFAQTGGLFGNIASRKSSAFLGSGVGTAGVATIGAAGSQFVGDSLRARGEGQAISALGKFGSSLAGRFGGGTKTQTSAPTSFSGTIDPKFGNLA